LAGAFDTICAVRVALRSGFAFALISQSRVALAGAFDTIRAVRVALRSGCAFD
jgi:hypothetical protein